MQINDVLKRNAYKTLQKIQPFLRNKKKLCTEMIFQKEMHTKFYGKYTRFKGIFHTHKFFEHVGIKETRNKLNYDF